MRAVFFICVCAWSAVAAQDINAMRNMPKYDARYDYLDVDGILDSKRLVRNYVDCLINIKPCTPEGKALKRLLPEALRTKCVRCTERQKRTAVKVIRRLKYEYPEDWAKLSSRWDPSGDFTRFFEEFLANEQFNTIPGTGNEIPGSSVQTPPPTPPPTPTAPRLPPAPPTPTVPRLPPAPSAPPTAATQPPTSQPPLVISTTPRPIVLNRFGDDGELMIGSPSSGPSTLRPMTAPIPASPASTAGSMRPIMPTRPTQMTWASAASDAVPTRFPLRPADMQPPYTTAITLIDQIGHKIIRTTELVTDILRNTVRAVVGR